jgi:hypothetical protein
MIESLHVTRDSFVDEAVEGHGSSTLDGFVVYKWKSPGR